MIIRLIHILEAKPLSPVLESFSLESTHRPFSETSITDPGGMALFRRKRLRWQK
jgi:hypothetical protein